MAILQMDQNMNNILMVHTYFAAWLVEKNIKFWLNNWI
jgi:hypothetical protein